MKRIIKSYKSSPTEELTIYERFAAGSLAGSFAQSCIYPLEVTVAYRTVYSTYIDNIVIEELISKAFFSLGFKDSFSTS